MKLFSSIVFSLILVLGLGFATNQAHAQVAASGCSTTTGYSATTGVSCNGATVVPLGCTSTAGFNTSTGAPCNGSTAAGNGYNGMVGTNGFLSGCTSTNGYSTTTGVACNTPMAGLVYTGNGTTINTNAPVVTAPAAPVDTTNPGLPTTGAGGNMAVNIALLLSSAVAAVFAIRYTLRYSHK
jgi:hypothetical protein